MDLAGIMFWASDLDDLSGKFCDHGPYPLMNTVVNLIRTDIIAPIVIPTISTTITSTKTTKICTTVDKIHYLQDDNDLQFFFVCLRNQKHPFLRLKCEPNFIFSENHQACIKNPVSSIFTTKF
jgi:hypothetical protein